MSVSGEDRASGFTGVAAVTFDGDGTLWDFESSMRAALQRSAEILAEAGLRHEEGAIEAEWLAGVREEVAAERRFDGASMEAIRLAAFEEAIRRCDPGRIGLAQSVCEQYMEDRFAALRPYVDAADALSALQQRFQLGLVTNGNTHPSRLGFEQSFAQVLIAAECGVHKPDPGIYALAAERLGVKAGACVHVGDDPHEDVEPARRAGMHSIWINREGKPWPSSLQPPDTEIRDLSSLSDLL